MNDYPAILRQIRAVQLAPHGSKRAKEKRLVKLRTASMKRELGRLAKALAADPCQRINALETA